MIKNKPIKSENIIHSPPYEIMSISYPFTLFVNGYINETYFSIIVFFNHIKYNINIFVCKYKHKKTGLNLFSST